MERRAYDDLDDDFGEEDFSPQDESNLRLLAIFHYVVGGLTALFSLIPVVHIVVGTLMIDGGAFGGRNAAPPEIGYLFVIMGSIIVVLGETLAILLLVAGRSLQLRRRYRFCFVVACISCLNMPIGTALGILTILFLNKDSARRMFGQRAPSSW